MNSFATTTQDRGDGGSNPTFFKLKKLGNSLAEWRTYLGVALFLVAFTLIFGLISLSFLQPRKEPLMFGLVILSILLSLGTFAALVVFIQRAKDQVYGDHPFDPNQKDILLCLGIMGLLGLAALAELEELPKRCYAGDNEDFKILGAEICGVITTMGVFSCLGVLTMLTTCILLAIAIRKAKEHAKLPPPVFPSGTEPAVMRWLDRSDPFNSSGRPYRQNSIGV